MDKRITEQPSHYDHLELMSVEQITANINRENMSVPVAVDKALPAINQSVDGRKIPSWHQTSHRGSL